METKELTKVHNESTLQMSSWTPKEVIQQIQAIQQLMKEGMHENEHYGKIPGCGDKAVLLKAGAEKLGLMFRLAPKYEITENNLPGLHKEFRITCSLYHIVSGNFWGQGVGYCTTMESKYRYRSGAGESTGQQVPKNYWDLKRMGKYKEAQELIGAGYITAKIDPATGKPDKEHGVWMIVEKIEKTENPDIADTYNTVLKIGKKRALVDATITATAASDIFTQDLEEGVELETQDQKLRKEAIKAQDRVETDSQVPVESQKTAPALVLEAENVSTGGLITHDERMEIVRYSKEKGIHHLTMKKALKEVFNFDGTGMVTKAMYPKVIEWIIQHDSAEVGK